MEGVIDIRLSLEQLGTGWQFGGSVTANTQEAWDSVEWEDERPKPTWEQLCGVYTEYLSEQQKLVFKAEAQAALDRSDLVALRCFKANILFPAAWTAYCEALREIVRTGEGPLPEQPEYPQGANYGTDKSSYKNVGSTGIAVQYAHHPDYFRHVCGSGYGLVPHMSNRRGCWRWLWLLFCTVPRRSWGQGRWSYYIWSIYCSRRQLRWWCYYLKF